MLETQTRNVDSGPRFPLLVPLGILAVSLAVVTPFFLRGNPLGHDFEFHVNSWMEVSEQWRHGIVYPRWAMLANHGFGEPRFVFYPPGSWLLGAALTQALPMGMVPGAYVFLCLLVAAACMFGLMRNWLTSAEAALVAALYAANPYHLVMVYWRSAFSELLASAIFPLVVLFAIRLSESRRAIAPLALVIGATWLINAPAAVIITYAVGVVFVVLAWLKRSFAVLVHGAMALVIGFGLAAFYTVPAAFEQRWINIGEAFSSGYRPQDNFLFTRIEDVEHTRFNLAISRVALVETVAAAVAALFSKKWKLRAPQLWWTLLALGGVAAALMFSITNPLWRILPYLRFVQFPWRWLFPLNIALAFFVFAALSQARFKPFWVTLVTVSLLASATAMGKFAYWDRHRVSELKAAMDRGRGYEGTDEYAPREANREALPRQSPDVEPLIGQQRALDTETGAIAKEATAPTAGKRAHIKIERWAAEAKTFTVDSAAPVTVTLKLLDYPAWKVVVNGKPSGCRAREDTGQMMIDLPAGQNHVEVIFSRTLDRWIGSVLSVLSGLIVLFLLRVVRQ